MISVKMYLNKYLVCLSILLLVLSGCSLKVDQSKAKQLVENLLNDLKNENYKDIDQFYISAFNEREPKDKKIEKYTRLKDLLGPIESWELLSTKQKYNDYTNINELELVYKINCKKIAAKATFLIINDAGNLKIIFQKLENMK